MTRAPCSSDLDRRDADAAAGRIHQHRLAVLEMRARQDHVKGRREDERDRCRFLEREVRRLGEGVRDGDDDELRHAAVAALPQEPILRAEVVVTAEARLADAAADAGMEDDVCADLQRYDAGPDALDVPATSAPRMRGCS